MPDRVISVPQATQIAQKIKNKFDNVNGRLGDLTQLHTENKTNLVDAINEAAKTGGSGEAVTHLPSLKIYGDISLSNKDAETKAYQYIWENPDEKYQRTGYCSLKWQGESSLSYPKKNFTIKFFHDMKYKRKDKLNLFPDLVLHKNKWVLKANWVDRSMAKNIVSCQLWGQIVKNRTAEPEAHLTDSPNFGAVNGHPITLYINDVFHGLYTFNIPKDEDLFGMEEDNPLHCAVCGDSQDGTGSTAFRIATINGWELEVPDAWASYEVEEEGQTVTKYVSDGLVALIDFVMTATDAEFKENLNNYLDVESAVDYYLMTYLDCGIDSLGRNLMLLTYDGGNKWYCSLYDADTTWGNGLSGSGPYNPTLPCPEGYEMKTSLLWERLEANFGDELYARWQALRQNIFRADYIKNQFSMFWDSIPDELYEADIERWKNQSEKYPNLPQWNVDFKTRVFNFIDARLPYCDTQIKAMRTPVPCTGITLNESSIRFTNGSPIALVATLEPENTTDEVVWTSSDDTVATVTNGTVYPLKNGSATITATCGNQTATCAVTVVGLSFEISLVGGHATLSNTDVIVPNASYTGTLTADTGFEFTSVVITMGGTDITATAYSNGTISIAQVTGDIVVTVETAYHYDETDLEYKLGSAFTMNGTNYIDTGFLYDAVSPLTIAIDFTQPDDMTTTGPYMFGTQVKNGSGVGWSTAYRGTQGIHNINQTTSIPATARLRAKAVLRYDPVRKVMATRASAPDTVTGNIVEKTSSYGHAAVNSTRPDRDAFVASLYLGGIHRPDRISNAPTSGVIHDIRIYSRRWTDAEVKQWLGLDELSTVFTDDMDQ